MGNKLRVFVSSSGLSTLYMAIYGRNSHQQGQTDLLFIDALALKPSQRELIYQAAQYHSFQGIFDLSRSLDENSSQVPGRIKQLTRKFKTHSVVKPIYDWLYAYKLRQEDLQHMHELVAVAGNFLNDSYASVELLLQPVLHVNKALLTKFPEAQVRYFEHGLGDYLDWKPEPTTQASFHCVFAEELSTYFGYKGEQTPNAIPLLGEKGFSELDSPFSQIFPQIQLAKIPKGKPVILLATQALAQFQVDTAYWDHFFTLCLNYIENPETAVFLLKPHPRQEPHVLVQMKHFFERKGLEIIIWEDPEVKSLNLEILFDALKEQVTHVFTPFSSALFYLSKLYPDRGIGFHYSLDSLSDFTQHTPDLYKKRWQSLRPYLKQVFGKNTIEMKPKPRR